MADKTRIPLADALSLASELVEILRPTCKRIEIAGSIRRKRPDVGDIEIVCIPTLRGIPDPGDLFGNKMIVVNEQRRLVDDLKKRGVLEDRLGSDGKAACGERFQRMVFRGFAADIFCVTPETWGVQFTLRTGPADFNKRLVLQRAQGGKILGPGMLISGGRLWELGRPLDTPEESALFAALGLAWLEPEARA